MPPPRDLLLHLGAGPEDPGAVALVAAASARRRAGAEVRVLLTHEGLAFAEQGRLGDLPEEALVLVCSRHAADRGWTAEDTPALVGWSSITSAFLELRADEAFWSALP